jgi:hypothetical protein
MDGAEYGFDSVPLAIALRSIALCRITTRLTGLPPVNLPCVNPCTATPVQPFVSTPLPSTASRATAIDVSFRKCDQASEYRTGEQFSTACSTVCRPNTIGLNNLRVRPGVQCQAAKNACDCSRLLRTQDLFCGSARYDFKSRLRNHSQRPHLSRAAPSRATLPC